MYWIKTNWNNSEVYTVRYGLFTRIKYMIENLGTRYKLKRLYNF